MSTKERTVKVRVAVAVDPDGAWNASGWGNADGPVDAQMAMEIACESVGTGENRFWLEVEVPIPETRSVTPSVEAADASN
jgi:hypothetical protein